MSRPRPPASPAPGGLQVPSQAASRYTPARPGRAPPMASQASLAASKVSLAPSKASLGASSWDQSDSSLALSAAAPRTAPPPPPRQRRVEPPSLDANLRQPPTQRSASQQPPPPRSGSKQQPPPQRSGVPYPPAPASTAGGRAYSAGPSGTVSTFSPVQSTAPQVPPIPQQHAGMQQQQQNWQPRVRKRLIVCCDGTWLDSDGGQMSKDQQYPSNVTRIGRAVKPVSSDGVAQVVFYQAGVGTEGGPLSRVAGGATAEGLAGNIREAYAFICLNWDPGDEIFLVGFSRGAYTARSVGGLIDQVGVLTKAGLKDLAIIFKDVQFRFDPKYESQYPGVPFPDKPSAADPQYAQELARLGLSRLNVPIRAIAVWDTVGSLGIPRVPWLERLGLQKRAVREYTFYDTSLSVNIQNAFQALALDEMRSSFVPALWEQPRAPSSSRRSKDKGKQPAPPLPRVNLRQVWFPGVHSNIGGGYADPGLQNITLAWMVAQLEPYLDFDLGYIASQWAAGRAYYHQTNQPPRPWSFGEIYKSLTGLYSLAGATTRTPGRYYRIDPQTGAPTNQKLRDTCEYIHPSARSRIELEGPGIEDRGVYVCKALAGYRLRLTGANHGEPRPVAVWESAERRKRDGPPRRILEESPLFQTEMQLLQKSPWVEQALYGKGGNLPTLGGGGGGGGSKRRVGGVAQEVYGPDSDLSALPADPGSRNAPNIGFVAPTGRRRSDDGRRLATADDGRRQRNPSRKGKERRHSTRS